MEKLAIEGGKKTVPEGLEMQWPIITEDDIAVVTDVLRRGVLWGPEAPEKVALEKEWAEYCGVKYCLATNTGTSALHACVAGAGVEAGDEVIVPAYTFWATAQAVLCQNAIPVFVDIEPETYTVDPAKIEEKITERTKAVIVVHVHGLPCHMDEINRIAGKHGIIVIEDAAHAHGAIYKGKKAGNLGDMAMFSLNGTKNLPGGEGGLITTNNPEFFEKARLTCMFGEKRVPRGNIRPYDAYTMGNNYRPTEMTNAFVRSQMKRMDDYNRRRMENAGYLNKELRKIKGIKTPVVPSDRTCVYHIYRITLVPEEIGYGDMDPEDFRWAVQNALFAEGVPAMEWHSFPVPGQKIFKKMDAYGKGCPWKCIREGGKTEYSPYRSEDYPETIKMFAKSFVLYAIHAANGIELMRYYVDAFKKVFSRIDDVASNPEYYRKVRAAL